MRRSSVFKYMSLIVSMLLLLSVSGVYAVWKYYGTATPAMAIVTANMVKFQYPDIYITGIESITPGGTLTKTGNTAVSANISSAGASFTVTIRNESDIMYYYNEAETKAGSDAYTVTGFEKGDEFPPKTYKSITVTFTGTGTSDIVFHFTVNKADVEDVVARTALDRFSEILNSDDYVTLIDAMDAHSGASRLTYIGNVVGANTTDSNALEGLFGDDFMSMDLDGDGDTEPITMMLKRENLDNNTSTGDEYSYTSGWGNNVTTVQGVEMTLYITAQSLSDVNRGDDIVVYAAAFTKYEGESKWVELVPLTKGKADANNYSYGAFGAANSFDTDTWISDNSETLRELVIKSINGQ